MTGRTGADTPGDAESAFYAAFENGDLEAMGLVWARLDDVVCVHPNGPPLVGYARVMQSWQTILENTAGFRISVEVRHQFTDGELAVRFVTETLFNENRETDPVAVAATNAYRKTDEGWRIVLHHASPGPHTIEVAAADEPEEDGPKVTVH